MAGILDNKCSSLLFQMKCDIYYATESQNSYGQIEKEWILDQTLPCSFYTLGDRMNDNNFVFNDDVFFKLETMLYGRTQKDVRKSSDGLLYPLSHILLTNISGATCNNEVFFFETNGGYQNSPTIFEIKTCQPFVGPFNFIEYFKIQLERSDTQVFKDNVICTV